MSLTRGFFQCSAVFGRCHSLGSGDGSRGLSGGEEDEDEEDEEDFYSVRECTVCRSLNRLEDKVCDYCGCGVFVGI